MTQRSKTNEMPAVVTAAADFKIEEFLENAARATLLRFSTAGSVDDGKSTLIGRLLHDSKNIYEDHLESLERLSSKNKQSLAENLALLTDGLRAEREQGITIDVAYRYFSTPRRHFILADTPGHEQYTRNMVTGASTASLMILLVDARNGVISQTKRHSFIGSLLGIPRFLVTINKMDLVGFSESVYEKIKNDFVEFASKLGIKELRFIPISALLGDNVVKPSVHMPWYRGETVLEYLENVYVEGDMNLVDFRFPVQRVMRPNQDYRGYAGQIASGVVRPGEEVIVLPGMRKSRVRSLDVYSPEPQRHSLQSAFAPMSVTLTLEDEIDVSRGDMIVHSNNMPRIQSQFEGMLVWMGDEKMDIAKSYLIMHTTRQAKVYIDEIKYKVDVNTLSRAPAADLKLNEIGRVFFTATKPLFLDAYAKSRSTGGFILVDPDNYHTVAAGMVIDRVPEEFFSSGRRAKDGSLPVSTNIHLEKGYVSRAERETKYGFRALTLWFTGLSGAGKSSIARELERRLFGQNRLVYRLDGDDLRFGLNRDLGFSKADRSENIRRAAEVARLFNQAGMTVICSFISPFKVDRAKAREIIGDNAFVEIYLDAPLAVCEERDPHGLYAKARSGEIKEFTGISSPYEVPDEPELTINTAVADVEESVRIILRYLEGVEGDV